MTVPLPREFLPQQPIGDFLRQLRGNADSAWMADRLSLPTLVRFGYAQSGNGMEFLLAAGALWYKPTRQKN